ncbi:MAG: hypothetical protein ABJL73_08390, partial [Lentilitoribacter sp.]
MNKPIIEASSIYKQAEKQGLEDGLNKKPCHWSGEWSDEARIYHKAYEAGRGQLPFTEDEINQIVKGCCGCLLWERWDRDSGMTDEELYQYLSDNLPDGSSCGPGVISKETNPSGLRIYATWNSIAAGKPEFLISQGMATVKRARMLYGIEDPS